MGLQLFGSVRDSLSMRSGSGKRGKNKGGQRKKREETGERGCLAFSLQPPRFYYLFASQF